MERRVRFLLALFINLVFLINHPFHKRFINCGQGERLYLCKSWVLGGRKYTQRFSYVNVKYNVPMKNILPLGNKGQFLKAGHSEQRFYGFMIVQSWRFKTHRHEFPFQDQVNANDDVGFQYRICWLGVSEINTVGTTKPQQTLLGRQASPTDCSGPPRQACSRLPPRDVTNERGRLCLYILLYCFVLFRLSFFQTSLFLSGN